MWRFRKRKCSAVGGYVPPATGVFLCCPLGPLSCLRLDKILQKKVKPKYNPLVMKRFLPDLSEGLFSFQRSKHNYDDFSLPNLAHCPFPVMVTVCFERNSCALLFFFKICIFIQKYRFDLFHKIMNVIGGRGEKREKKTNPTKQSLPSPVQCLWKSHPACLCSRVFSPLPAAI